MFQSYLYLTELNTSPPSGHLPPLTICTPRAPTCSVKQHVRHETKSRANTERSRTTISGRAASPLRHPVNTEEKWSKQATRSPLRLVWPSAADRVVLKACVILAECSRKTHVRARAPARGPWAYLTVRSRSGLAAIAATLPNVMSKYTPELKPLATPWWGVLFWHAVAQRFHWGLIQASIIRSGTVWVQLGFKRCCQSLPFSHIFDQNLSQARNNNKNNNYNNFPYKQPFFLHKVFKSALLALLLLHSCAQLKKNFSWHKFTPVLFRLETRLKTKTGIWP